MKRILAMVLTFAMILSLMPTVVLAQEQASTEVDIEETTVEGTNSFGMLVSNGIAQGLNSTESSRSGYGITGLEVNGNVATITYETKEKALVMVAIYTEDGMQLLTSEYREVVPEEQKTTLRFSRISETYFLAKAFLLDIHDYSPLCPAFETPMYTSDMQKLLVSTVEDYAPEQVYNLDEDKTTNFAVFNDDTIIIKATQTSNILVSADNEQYRYIFESPDEQITGLTAGNEVAYLYGDGDMLLFKVASVTTEGTTATVTGIPMEIQDIFAYMKLEYSGDSSQITLDSSSADPGVTFEGVSGGAQTRSWEGGSTDTIGYEFSLKGTFENETDNEVIDGEVKVNGSLLFSLETKLDYYISLDRQYIKYTVTPSAALGIEVSGALNINALKLGSFKFSPFAGLNMGFEPRLKLGFSGKVSLSVKFSFTIGLQLEHRKGGHFSANNLCTSPKVETVFEFEGEIFIGLDLHPEASIISDEIAKLELTGLVGVCIKGKLEINVFEKDDPPSGNMVHGCNTCLKGEILGEVKIAANVEFLKDPKLSYSKELVAVSIKLKDFYYSHDHKDLGWGECPHYRFQVRILTLDEHIQNAAGVSVSLSDGTSLGTTNKNGLLVVYLPEGNYTFRANIGGQPVVYTKFINYYGSITLTSNEDYWNYLREMEKLQIQPDSFLSSSVRDSGTCGDNISWVLYESGFIRITGSGAMDSYQSFDETPWSEYQDIITSVHITDEVSYVAPYSFYKCTNLKKVILDDCVTSLGEYAFHNCTSLQEVKLPVSLVTENAFVGCSNLVEIQYSYGSDGKMAQRGEDSQDDNYYVKTLEYQGNPRIVVFDENITHIADYAFNQCSALHTVKLPTTLVSIGKLSFGGCNTLGSIVLPEGLESLGENCFTSCSGLTEITIPSTLTQIPKYCFSWCSGLTDLTIPVTVKNLEEHAFYGCSGLKTLTLPVDLVTDNVFGNTGNISKIHYTYGKNGIMAPRTHIVSDVNYYSRTPEYINREALQMVLFDEGIQTVADYSFRGCQKLEIAELPSTLTAIGARAFENCTTLETINLPRVTSLGEYCFVNCKSLTNIQLPSSLTTIPEGCFQNCSAMQELILPDVVTSLGANAFVGCTELVDVTLPVDLITENAFGTTGKITRLHYTIGQTGEMAERGTAINNPNYYTRTLEYANRQVLTTVLFDEGITTIASRAFSDCTALADVTLPSSIRMIGNNAFYGCKALEHLSLPKGQLTLGSSCFASCTSLKSIPLPVGLIKIGESCFSGCTALSTVNFPSTLDTIPSYAFQGCTALTELVIPKTVTLLEADAFCKCTGLKTITIPVDVATDSAFNETGNVTTIHYTYGNTGKMLPRGETSYLANYYSRTLEYVNRKSLATVSFAEGITVVANRTFSNCTALETVNLPTSLKTIGNYAFYACTALREVRLPEGLTALGGSCFSGCTALSTVNFPSTLETIPAYTFQGCTALTELAIPKTVTLLEADAFCKCTGLKTITIPVDLATDSVFNETGNVTTIHYTYGNTGKMLPRGESSHLANYYSRTLEYVNRATLATVSFAEEITVVANRAFSNCTALTDVTLPSSIHTIGNYAFYACKGLEHLSLPKGQLTLGSSCFASCTSLKSIPLPVGLIKIGESCFSGCTALSTVNFPSTLDTIPSYAFQGCTALTELVIPKTVTLLDANAFCKCTGLKTITIPVDVATDSAFNETGNVTTIHYTYGNTGKMLPRGETSYLANYYSRTLEYVNRKSLATVSFAEGITVVANRTFSSCTALETVTLPTSLKTIGNYAFYACTALREVRLPEGLTTLGGSCFSGCTALSTVNFPSTLDTIPSYAFQGCTALTELAIPKTVTLLEADAFCKCTGLKTITIPVDLATDSVFNETGNVTTIHYTYGNTGKMLPRSENSYLANYYSRTLEYVNRETLATVSFADKITVVANRAFSNCTALGTVIFYGDCPSISDTSFSNVTATVHYPQGNTTYLTNLMGNYGGTLTWEPHNLMEPKAAATPKRNAETPEMTCEDPVAIQTEDIFQGTETISGETVYQEAVSRNQVYQGTNQTEFTPEQVAVQVSTFTGLVPGQDYLILAVWNLEWELLAPGNVLFIDQGTAGEDGTLSFRYVQRVPKDTFYIFVCGASDKSLADAQVVLPQLQANGEAQALRPTVTYQGEQLVEEVHYIITEGAVFTDGGTYTATLRGINEYSGLYTFTYTVAPQEASNVPTVTLKYPTLSFEDVIVLNVYYAAENLEDVVEMGLITYSEKVEEYGVDTAESVVPGYAWSESDGFYFSSTNGIAAKDLGDKIYFAVYAKLADGNYFYTQLFNYSPKTYAYNQLKTGNAQMKQIVAAMLNYGAAAQKYFNYNTDALVNADMNADQMALVENYRADMISSVVLPDDAKKGEMIGNGGFNRRYPTISFEGAFCINYYFIPSAVPAGEVTMYYWNQADFNAAESLSKENATEAITMEIAENGEYLAVVDGIAAKDLDSGVYVAFCYSDGTTEYCSGVIGYSIGAYCKNQAATSGTLADLAAATAVYGYYAKQLFA